MSHLCFMKLQTRSINWGLKDLTTVWLIYIEGKFFLCVPASTQVTWASLQYGGWVSKAIFPREQSRNIWNFLWPNLESHMTFHPLCSSGHLHHKTLHRCKESRQSLPPMEEWQVSRAACGMRDTFSAIFETFNLPQPSSGTAVHISPTYNIYIQFFPQGFKFHPTAEGLDLRFRISSPKSYSDVDVASRAQFPRYSF